MRREGGEKVRGERTESEKTSIASLFLPSEAGAAARLGSFLPFVADALQAVAPRMIIARAHVCYLLYHWGFFQRKHHQLA